MAVNAFAMRSPAQPLDMAPKANAFTNMTAPAPSPAPVSAAQVTNAFTPRPQAQPKAPAPNPAGNAFKAFATGFAGPEAINAVDDRHKADAQAKAKAALLWMQHTAQQPAERRAQFTLQSAQDIARDTGQPYEAIVASARDPNAFSDEALNGAIAKFSALAGVAPTVPEPMSAYQQAQIDLAKGKADNPSLFNTPKGVVSIGPDGKPTLVYDTAAPQKPQDLPEGMWYGQDGKGPPQPIPGYVDMRTKIAQGSQSPGSGKSIKNLTPAEIEARGYPKGTVVQVDENGKEYVNSRPSTQQTGQPTESERSAGLHATVSINGLRNLMATEAAGYNRAGVQEQAAGFVGGENERLYDQAADEFIDGYLRAMTGAAATKTEIETYRKQWFPTWGDTAPVIRQKAVGRLNALKGMKSKAGRAWHPEWDTMIASLEQQLAAPQAAEGPKFPDGTPITAETLQQLPPNLRAIYSRMLPQEDDDTALNAHIDSLFPADDGVDQGPIVGQVEDGFRFVGGDPGDPNNWEPVQ